jgi:hypothetical protein
VLPHRTVAFLQKAGRAYRVAMPKKCNDSANDTASRADTGLAKMTISE